jgi:hypothetical protein
MHPYTKIEFVQRDLKVSRLTATKYLEALGRKHLHHRSPSEGSTWRAYSANNQRDYTYHAGSRLHYDGSCVR